MRWLKSGEYNKALNKTEELKHAYVGSDKELFNMVASPADFNNKYNGQLTDDDLVFNNAAF